MMRGVLVKITIIAILRSLSSAMIFIFPGEGYALVRIVSTICHIIVGLSRCKIIHFFSNTIPYRIHVCWRGNINFILEMSP